MAEQLAFKKPPSQSGAIHRHKDVLSTAAVRMNLTGDHFLAGSSFTKDNNGTITGSNIFDGFDN